MLTLFCQVRPTHKLTHIASRVSRIPDFSMETAHAIPHLHHRCLHLRKYHRAVSQPIRHHLMRMFGGVLPRRGNIWCSPMRNHATRLLTRGRDGFCQTILTIQVLSDLREWDDACSMQSCVTFWKVARLVWWELPVEGYLGFWTIDQNDIKPTKKHYKFRPIDF